MSLSGQPIDHAQGLVGNVRAAADDLHGLAKRFGDAADALEAVAGGHVQDEHTRNRTIALLHSGLTSLEGGVARVHRQTAAIRRALAKHMPQTLPVYTGVTTPPGSDDDSDCLSDTLATFRYADAPAPRGGKV